MTASRKLYVAMAEKFKEQKPKEDSDSYAQWVRMVCGAANVFHHDNAGFDVTKFLKASGFEAIQAHSAAGTLGH